MYKSFEEKQHPTKVNGNRHDVRKASVNSSVVGEEIKKKGFSITVEKDQPSIPSLTAPIDFSKIIW